MELTSSYLKNSSRFGWLNLIYFRARKILDFGRIWLLGQRKEYLNPSTKTLVGLMKLKERQLYKRKN